MERRDSLRSCGEVTAESQERNQLVEEGNSSGKAGHSNLRGSGLSTDDFNKVSFSQHGDRSGRN